MLYWTQSIQMLIQCFCFLPVCRLYLAPLSRPSNFSSVSISEDTAVNSATCSLGRLPTPLNKKSLLVFSASLTHGHVPTAFESLAVTPSLRSLPLTFLTLVTSTQFQTCLFQKQSEQPLHELQMASSPTLTPILPSPHWLPIKERFHFKILLFTFRALNNQAPSYLSELLLPYQPPCSPRSASSVSPHPISLSTATLTVQFSRLAPQHCCSLLAAITHAETSAFYWQLYYALQYQTCACPVGGATQQGPPPSHHAPPPSHHAWVGDDHALALLGVLLPLQLLPLQHVSDLLLGHQGLAAPQQVEQHLVHRQHLLAPICKGRETQVTTHTLHAL